MKLPKFVYHGTLRSSLKSILRNGLRPSKATSSQAAVYLAGSEGTARNYAGMYGASQDEFVVLRVDTKFLDQSKLGPDDYEMQNYLDEPWGTVGRDIKGIDSWHRVSWEASLKYVDQFVYYGAIPVEAIQVPKAAK